MTKYQIRRTILGCILITAAAVGCASTLHSTPKPEDIDVISTDAINYVPETTVHTERVLATTPDGYTICYNCGQAIHSPDNFLTSTEMLMLAKLVEGEAGGESFTCKKAVASVVLNRMNIDGAQLVDEIFAEGEFEVAGYIDVIEPSEDSINAVKEVCYYGSTVPRYVTFFRADYYHEWGDLHHYMQLDNTYFSYSQAIKDEQCR